MALSGVYTYSVNRDFIIKNAMLQIGVLRAGDNPPTYRVNAAAQVLNIMILGWQSQNIGLWLNKQLCLFLNKANTESYSIGPSGDHCTDTPYDTTTSAAAEEDNLTITVSDATNITDGDNIGIELDDGTR